MIETISLILNIIMMVFIIILKWPEIKACFHRWYHKQKSKNMGILEPDKEYALKLNEKYQFEYREIELTSIWDEAVIANVKFDTQSQGIRIDVGSSTIALGVIMITLVNVNYDSKKEKRYAIIKVKRVRQIS
ncbi:hypothetical protein B9J78_02570 [bacterium Unc6]|nr:hypothetical protein [bacterium Unc6]